MSLFLEPIAPTPGRPPRAWQAEALPLGLAAIDAGERALIIAVTGSGKSVLAAEHVAQHLIKGGNDATVVVTTPTRRLVEQLAGTIGDRIGHGRVGRFFTRAKEAERQVVVACNNSALSLAAVLRRQDRAVSLWIPDEAHRTESEGLTVAAHALKARATLGFTATAFRSDEAETLQLFDRVVYRYGFREALRDQVIVPWRPVPWTGAREELDVAVMRMVRDHAVGPGVINASSIEDARQYATWLTDMGIPAAAVHSQLADVEQDGMLTDLREGRLRCVVYPSLLSEGADFPWLRWIALRRDVKSRVRFIQEVGRVLRTWPGKVEALVLDPLALFERFSLSYDEEIGTPPPAGESFGGGGGGGVRGDIEPAFVRPADVVSSWARGLFLAAELDAILGERQSFSLDRSGPATPSQLDTILRLAWAARWLPHEHTVVLHLLATRRDMPDRGTASDLLEVLSAMAKRRAAWIPPLPVQAPSLELLDQVRASIEEGGWYSAGACRHGVRAVAIVRGQRLVASSVKSDDTNVNSSAVHIAAARLAARHAGVGATVHVSDARSWRALMGKTRESHPAVKAALAGQAPVVTYVLVEPKENPASGLAWRELVRAEKQKGAHA